MRELISTLPLFIPILSDCAWWCSFFYLPLFSLVKYLFHGLLNFRTSTFNQHLTKFLNKYCFWLGLTSSSHCQLSPRTHQSVRHNFTQRQSAEIGPILTWLKFRCHAVTNHQIHLTLGSKRMLLCQNEIFCLAGLKQTQNFGRKSKLETSSQWFFANWLHRSQIKGFPNLLSLTFQCSNHYIWFFDNSQECSNLFEHLFWKHQLNSMSFDHFLSLVRQIYWQKRLCPPVPALTLFFSFLFPCFKETEWLISALFSSFVFFFLFFSFFLLWLREREWLISTLFFTLQQFVFPLSVALSALCFSLYRENKGAADNEHLKHWHINHNLRHYFPTTLNSYFWRA